MQEYFMQQAILEAEKAFELNEVPIGAVVVRHEKVIARAFNLRETTSDPTAHAEILAIRQASRVLGGWRLIGCDLYVTIEPCPMCAGAIMLARIENLIIGAMDKKGGAAGSLLNIPEDERFNHKTKIITGVMEEECSSLMKNFFAQLRNKNK
ncbi:MAG: tRNA adenosine(34) deaminase TadA [Bacillota bacterium]